MILKLTLKFVSFVISQCLESILKQQIFVFYNKKDQGENEQGGMMSKKGKKKPRNKKEEKLLDFDYILKTSWHHLWKRKVVLLPFLSFLLFLIVFLPLLFTTTGLSDISNFISSDFKPNLNFTPRDLVYLGISGLIIVVLSLVVTSMTYIMVKNEIIGKKQDLNKIIDEALIFVPKLLLVDLIPVLIILSLFFVVSFFFTFLINSPLPTSLVIILVIIGIILAAALVTYVFYLMIRAFLFVIPIMLIEKKGFFPALKSSFRLFDNYKRNLFFIVLIIIGLSMGFGILEGSARMILSFIASPLFLFLQLSYGENVPPLNVLLSIQVIIELLSYAVSIVGFVFMTFFRFYTYLELKKRVMSKGGRVRRD